MIRKFWRRVSWPIVFAGLSAPFIANCGSMPKMPGGGGCPAYPAAATVPTWRRSRRSSRSTSAKSSSSRPTSPRRSRGASRRAAEMQELSAKIDGDLKTACGNLAHDLGATGDYKDGQDACKAAEKAIGDVKAKMGASVSIKLDITEPHCGVDINAYARLFGPLRRDGHPRQGGGQVRGRQAPGLVLGRSARASARPARRRPAPASAAARATRTSRAPARATAPASATARRRRAAPRAASAPARAKASAAAT